MRHTWITLQHSIYAVAVSGYLTNWTLAVSLTLCLVPYSQLCLCVDECEQTLLHVERQKASAMPFSALETHCGGGDG